MAVVSSVDVEHCSVAAKTPHVLVVPFPASPSMGSTRLFEMAAVMATWFVSFFAVVKAAVLAALMAAPSVASEFAIDLARVIAVGLGYFLAVVMAPGVLAILAARMTSFLATINFFGCDDGKLQRHHWLL
ncbi:hypothetical protein L7F22_030175 [Adiantum nelumboides]|nr:hypothetical protein [Adiantum nelumboides]